MTISSLAGFRGRWWFAPCVVLIATALVLPINGYVYGIYDHAYHIPRLEWLKDPTLYNPDDPFVETLDAYPSVFWWLLRPLSEIVPLPALFLGLYYLSQCLFGYTMLRLSRLLYGSQLIACLSFAAFLLAKSTSGVYKFPDGQFVPRTLVFPIAIFALELFLRGYWYPSFFLAGLAVNLHGRVAVHVLILLITGLLWQARTSGLKRIFISLAVAATGAAPSILWSALNPLDVPLLTVDPKWVEIVKLALPTMQNIFSDELVILLAHLSTLGFLVVFLIAQRMHPAEHHRETLLIWVFASIGMILLGGLFTDVFPLPVLMQFEFVRAGLFLPFFALPAFLNSVVREWRLRRMPGPSAVLLIAAALAAPFGSVTALVAVASRLSGSRRIATITVAVVSVFTIAVSVYYFSFKHLTEQTWLVATPNNPWVEAARWIKENTPKDAIILFPPHLNTAQLGGEFRVISQRSVVVSRHEGDLSALSYVFAFQWYQRMQDLTAGEFMVGTPMSRITGAIRKGSESLSEADVLALAKKYRAGYVLRERSAPLALAPVFENEQFLVYQVQ